MQRRHVWFAAVSALAIIPGAAAAAAADPPGRVARLNYIRGSVSFRPATLEDWGPAPINYPLVTGDRLWTDGDSVAEMHIGSSAVRLAPFTAFAILDVDDRTTQLRLAEGMADIVIRRLDAGEQFEVDTPSAALALIFPGVYRVEVSEDGTDTSLTVRRGEGEMYADDLSFRVFEGQAGRMWGLDTTQGDVSQAERPDSWERWCRARDEREDRSVSLQYVSQEMVGYEDLDDYGTWSTVPDYGVVWRPRLAPAGWAPYTDGRWAWVEPWGWTWVDDAPWGFAPFHYGRWACHRGEWIWVPGAYVARPYYAPALVAFLGGDDWGFSIGWFPLGPREPYFPPYRASYGYLRNVNITHVNITTVNLATYTPRSASYANRTVAGALRAVPRESFLSGRSLRGVARPVTGVAIERAEVMGHGPSAVPRAESVLAQRNVRVSRRAQEALGRAVVVRSAPPPAVASFQARQPLLQASGGRPVDDSSLVLRQGTSDGLPVRALRRGPARPDAASDSQQARPRNADSGTNHLPSTRPLSQPDARPADSDGRAVSKPQVRPRGIDGGTPALTAPTAFQHPTTPGQAASENRAAAGADPRARAAGRGESAAGATPPQRSSAPGPSGFENRIATPRETRPRGVDGAPDTTAPARGQRLGPAGHAAYENRPPHATEVRAPEAKSESPGSATPLPWRPSVTPGQADEGKRSRDRDGAGGKAFENPSPGAAASASASGEPAKRSEKTASDGRPSAAGQAKPRGGDEPAGAPGRGGSGAQATPAGPSGAPSNSGQSSPPQSRPRGGRGGE